MDRYNWTEIPEESLNPLMTRRVIHTPAMTIAKLALKKGAIVPLHSHINEQVSMVETGSLRFDMNGTSVVVKAGDALVIPPQLPHYVEVLEDTTATDLFTPPRTDWISRDDSYLRGPR